MATNNTINESGFPWPASQGGTGRNTLTVHSVLVGNATSPITQLALGTNGQALIGSTGADPVFANLTSTGSTVTYTNGAHALNLDLTSFTNATAITAANINLAFSGGTNSTWTTRTGFAARIDNIVYFAINLVSSALGSGVSTAILTFTTGLGTPSTTSQPWIQSIYFKNIAWTGTINFYAQGSGSAIQMFFFQTTTAGVKTNLAKAAFTNPVTIHLSGWYYTAP